MQISRAKLGLGVERQAQFGIFIATSPYAFSSTHGEIAAHEENAVHIAAKPYKLERETRQMSHKGLRDRMARIK